MTNTSADACHDTSRLLGAHLDGQLDAVKTLEVEEHLAACEVCRERAALDRAIRGSLKKAVRANTPDDVRARMLAAMAAETAREEKRDEEAKPAAKERGTLRHWRTMLPLASAAALALAWGAASNSPVAHGANDVMRAGFGNDDLLRDFVGAHSRAYPPEQRDPAELSRYVGVPVRVPRFQNARFVGGRLVTVHGGEAAAMLQYEMQPAPASSGRRVTIFVYNPRNVQVGGANLAPRAVGTSQVRVGRTDGYSVAVTQHGGVGYTIASDLDPESNTNLVSVVDSE
jgi:anti-sigma factor RsiW